MPEIKCGLEIHGYILVEESKQKLFCSCEIDHDATPNTNICPVCTGQPGNKPMLPNKEAVDKIIAIAKMLNCKVNHNLLFQRKHYSWPDLPNGYQKTMSGSYSVPVGENGEFLGISILDVHLEEDPARWDPVTGCVDYNRSGFPLVEIVTAPDFKDSDQVRDWLKKLVTTLGYIKAIDKNAGIKADVNISIAPKFDRAEIKNVNSLKSIVRAMEYEIARQQKEVSEGKDIPQQTRTWSDADGKTLFMRSKETAQDYMFIPDPDLPIVKISDKYIKEIASKLPQKPHEKIEKFVREHKIDKVDAQVIASEIILAELFEKVALEISPVLAARWLRRELMRVVNYAKLDLDELQIDESHIIELLRMVEKKEITDTTAQKILEKLIEKPFSPEEYVKKEGLSAVSDSGELEKFCSEAIQEAPQAVEDFKAGSEKSLNFIVGMVMKKTKGTASPKEVNEILRKLLK